MDGQLETLDIAIVGPGAIGTTIAAALHEAGRTPRLCGRTPRNELTLDVGEERVVVPGPVHTDPRQAAVPADLVFLAVKATQLHAASPWLAALCGPGTVVCVLQNGVEQVAMVRPLLPRDSDITPSVVWFPAQSLGDGLVQLRGEPRLTLPDTPACGRVGTALRGTRCTVETAENFTALAWRKLLQNAAAGLMALTGRRSGLYSRPDIADLALAYLDECVAVARAEGAHLGDDVPGEILTRFQQSPADMGTSILTDREARRPLEWDIRNGVISRLGRVHKIPTPISDTIVTLLAATSDGPG
ncbi:oxidoreductase [Streptomyces sp. NPDC001255]|uniref:oxidoreductase n=1 Tax=Streptomyces sp. NPDC001255 TaxID=3364550 RepID=UPI0036B540F2